MLTVSPCRINHGIDLQFDGFVGHRAGFFAHNAVNVVRPRQAAVAIHPGQSHGRMPLFFQRQLRDGAGRAGLTASRAVETAIPDPRIQKRGKQIAPTAFQEAGLQSLGRANPHTFIAANAQFLKIDEIDTRRADQVCGGALFNRLNMQQCHRGGR